MDKPRMASVVQPEYGQILADLAAPKLQWADGTHAWVDQAELAAWRASQNTSKGDDRGL